MKVIENLKAIQHKINEACERANRNSEDIKVIAVTKYVSTERALEALDAGIIHLGENRDDGLLEKWEVIKDKPVWHFIGTLQSRKVKNIIDKVEYIHSVDRLSLAQEINKRANKKINCFIQVNVSGEESKQGIHPEEVKEFIAELSHYPNILVSGLMTMAPLTSDDEILRSCFQKLKRLQTDIQELKLEYAPCHELSMGMSNDFEIAIEEGATMIRIGTALVGNEE
ncbi:YggS family pyridoxal phosphate-dependent enzyme [Bacillus sp. DTU_2020_1000418_1_SI_GHA_SEK_038]|uniref:YggS family pyridoxal phosphate-dependent enzyme n=1 Tax=Bacillus sp. DTU_2020_1000418_1_SI_GHA_SEK_038 TaxID=3077585 RepID=UPI0028E557CD|nr:YggS family pyridoxal phosphate-dependent enzyme [Bacillus sp. DTU_2020_1000418_1_SI_GHA_SEK_038]WNS77096.1 YggS family pyridoxal phosphate-dependent enzyme [Bacillus sp. DTU_2020_1000418_1_SI_GHA_SEK_038]